MIDDEYGVYAALADCMRAAGTVTVLTGAGISADSGVPTFRDAQEGLWARYRPEDLATPEAFERDPDTVWRWYRSRRHRLDSVEPNAGHLALAAMADRLPDLHLITQNVDGLHQAAGHHHVIEFHGSIRRNVCHAEGRTVQVDDDTDTAPACPHCGARVRPGVVWFGEAIPADALDSALRASEQCDVFIAIGTSALVYPAAGLAEVARERGAKLAEINPDSTSLSTGVDFRMAARAVDALPRLLACLERGRS